MYFIYSVILAAGMIATSPYWLFQAIQKRHYLDSLMQRLGLHLPILDHGHNPVWLHAVSVGEVLAAKALLAALRRARPDLPVVVSTVTLTGQALAKKELAGTAAFFYFPFDWDFCVRRFLRKLLPSAVVIMETELWPNFLKGCARQNVPVFLANGRISDKSVRRYRRVRRLVRAMIGAFSRIGVQTQEDRRRFIDLGATEGKIVVTGNLKFDLQLPSLDPNGELLELIRSSLGLEADGPAIVIGSTMKGEEPLLLEQFMRIRTAVPGVKLILAPRHPQRFAEVKDLVKATGVRCLRRTELSAGAHPGTDILILDTIGELRTVYSLASVAVIGGSFLPHGGHNPLEPAALGKALVFGPDMSNFRELAGLFLKEQSARQCAIEDLATAVTELLQNPRARHLLGQRAAHTYRMNQGATETTMSFLLPYIS